MPARLAPAVLLGLAVCATATGAAAGGAEGPPAPAPPGGSALDGDGTPGGGGGLRLGGELLRQERLQTAGKAALAAALALVVAGVTLIEVDPYATAIGDWGFAAVGAGLGTFVASAFLLGFSHPVHVRDHPYQRRRDAPAATARGLAVGYARAF